MTTHILAKAMTDAKDSVSALTEQADTKYDEFKAAVAAGDQKVQQDAAAALHGFVHTAANMASAMHDYGKSVLPTSLTGSAQPASVNASVVSAKKR